MVNRKYYFNNNFTNEIGVKKIHDAERLFLALIDCSQDYIASRDKSEPSRKVTIDSFFQEFDTVPEKYLDKNYSLKFYDVNEGKCYISAHYLQNQII